mmetsp:Transcript_2227/g.5528  ORF Transcript_2227/g.5528 Transcript_2227/m.5528 type:complete len:682 (+) Transcript_2227:2-2047(+)
MRTATFAVLAATVSCAEVGSPITKVVQLLKGLASKVTNEGEAEQREYEQLVAFCEDNAKSLQHNLKNNGEKKESLEATIEKANADIEVVDTKISELSNSIAQAEEDLDRATKLRNQEHEDWVSADAELMQTVDALQRAINIVKKGLTHDGFVQVDQQAAQRLASLLQVVLEAKNVETQTKAQLTGFLQAREDKDDGLAAYMQAGSKTSADAGSAILDTLGELENKASGQRADAQKKETQAQFNYDMLKQGLTDQLKTENKEQSEARQKKGELKEVLATAEGDLESTNADIESDSTSLRELQQDCMQKASDHETSVKERTEELKALATAEKAIKEKTGGADSRANSLLQLSSGTQDQDSSVPGVIKMLGDLSRKSGDMKLAFLATEMTSASEATVADGADVFAKVKELIREMLGKLQEDAKADEKKHAYCEAQKKEAAAKVDESQSDVDKTTSRIDKADSTIVQLREKITQVQGELSELESMKGEATANRQMEHEQYLVAKKEYEQGIDGVQMAIKVLKEYYGKNSEFLQQQLSNDDHSGAASGIIGLLEVAESDFSKLLAEVEADEEEAQQAFDKFVKESKISKIEKSKALEYAKKEKTRVEKSLSELKDDVEAQQDALDANLDFQSKIKKECAQKVETYEERVSRREAELQGLKTALQILEEETADTSFLAVKRTVRRHV